MHPTASPGAEAPFRVVIAYRDIPAGRRAIGILTEQLNTARVHVHLHPVMRRFEDFEDPARRERAVDEALAADLIILADGAHRLLPPGVEQWFAEVLAGRPGSGVALIATFGPVDTWSIDLQGTTSGGNAVPSADRFAWPHPLTAAA